MSNKMPSHAVAIVGMAGRFPGARNLDEFWHNISTGVGKPEYTNRSRNGCRRDPQRRAIESEFRAKIYHA